MQYTSPESGAVAGFSQSITDTQAIQNIEKTRRENKQAQDQERMLDTLVPADEWDKLAQYPETQKQLKGIIDVQNINGQNFMTLKDKMNLRKITSTNQDINATYALESAQNARKQIEQINLQIPNVKKPEEAQALQQQLQQLTTQEKKNIDFYTSWKQRRKEEVLTSPDVIGKVAIAQAKPETVAHNVIELFSSDGKTAQKFQYNPSSQRYDIAVGEQYPVKSQVINVNAQAGTFKPGTLDYMIEKYETDGVIPPFGMGQVGAKQRAQFFDKAAERAKQRGDTGGEQAVRGAEFKSNQSALTDLTKRENLINSFKVRIDETSDRILIPLIKKYDLQNPRFANWTVNKLAQIMGSGDLASLKLALNSVSVEVGKVEFNALGIQQLSDTAAKFMKDIHDENMQVHELLKVIDTSKALGETGIDAVRKQRKGLASSIGAWGRKNKEMGNTPPTNLKPIPDSVITAIRAKAKTREAAEQMATDMGYDFNTRAK